MNVVTGNIVVMVVMLIGIAVAACGCGQDVPHEVEEQKREDVRAADAEFERESESVDALFDSTIEAIESQFEKDKAFAEGAITSEARQLRMRSAEEARDSAIEQAKRDKDERIERAVQERDEQIEEAERGVVEAIELKEIEAWLEANNINFMSLHKAKCAAMSARHKALQTVLLEGDMATRAFNSNPYWGRAGTEEYREAIDQLERNRSDWIKSYMEPYEYSLRIAEMDEDAAMSQYTAAGFSVEGWDSSCGPMRSYDQSELRFEERQYQIPMPVGSAEQPE